MFSNNRSPSCCLLLVIITSLAHQVEFVRGGGLFTPRRCRTEGKIMLSYVHEDKTVKHHLVFSESLDYIKFRSAISIGYVSHPPAKYYSRPGSSGITVASNGLCSTIPNKNFFTPELSWFVDLMLPGVDLKDSLRDHAKPTIMGPTDLLSVIGKLMGDINLAQKPEIEVHRNIPCKVYYKTFKPANKDFSLKLDVFMPTSGVEFRNLNSSYFTVIATTIFDDSSVKRDVDQISFVIDYYDIDSMDNDPVKMDRLRDDFNLPLGVGCSEFVDQIKPEIEPQSFSIEYQQRSRMASVMLAYDHYHGFMRKEFLGSSVNIWDLNEDLMYNIDSNATNQLFSGYISKHQSCSVLQVVDEKLGPAYRPYDKVGESLDVLKMIGASQLSYMGRGTARDLPCSIYETILPEAPDLFALTEEQLNRKSAAARDYIVQFYLLRGDQSEDSSGFLPVISEATFWPAQIVLYKRFKDLGLIEYVDSLDVYDFSWSLDGWEKKGNQLFIASECFNDDDQQINLELALTFDRVHEGASKPEDKLLLPANKYKLEFDLTNDILSLMQISKMHMIDYELRLLPNHINLELVIGDRREEKNLTYFGSGTLPDTYSNNDNRIVFNRLSEDSCVSVASLLEDINMVVYCPSTVEEESSCISLYYEAEPTIKITPNVDANQPTCQVYRFTPLAAPKRGVSRVEENASRLIGHEIDFVATVPGNQRKEILRGMVKNYDISHVYELLNVEHYAFVVAPNNTSEAETSTTINRNVRSFDSISYSNIGDCAKMCNLDVNCRSYSYCSLSQNLQCILSSLDIRTSKLRDQLIHSKAPLSDNSTLIIKGNGFDGGKQSADYELRFTDHCSIYERDYLSMFRQTDEIIRINRALVAQFPKEPTTFDCAKRSVDLEFNSPQHHVAMFAYCSSSSTCLLDENLFATKNNSAAADQPTKSTSGELLCRVYRKKYQTYFNVSTKVLKPQSDRQVELQLATVEECARACWNRFGQVCASFDYCSPGSCLINQVSDRESNEFELETRSSCLHYERDLRLDELRRRHMIGRHQLLIEQQGESKTTFGGFMLSLLTYALVFGAFIYGLVLGRQVNDKMEAVTILRQSISAGAGSSNRTSTRDTAILNATRLHETFSSSSSSQDLGFDSNDAIRLDEIKRTINEDNEPLEQDF